MNENAVTAGDEDSAIYTEYGYHHLEAITFQ